MRRRSWGLLTKNHLFLGLLCLQSGRVRKDSDPTETWTLPKEDGTGRHKQLYEVIERGLNVAILDASIWAHESVDDLRLLVAVDNQDNVRNMADHEVHAFEQISKAIEAEQGVANPTRLWERVYDKIDKLKSPFQRKVKPE